MSSPRRLRPPRKNFIVSALFYRVKAYHQSTQKNSKTLVHSTEDQEGQVPQQAVVVVVVLALKDTEVVTKVVAQVEDRNYHIYRMCQMCLITHRILGTILVYPVILHILVAALIQLVEVLTIIHRIRLATLFFTRTFSMNFALHLKIDENFRYV